ncbi:protein kinase domain-containing protein [Kribbella sp. CA-247076]|uniref:protein kinase domain-containing protein n=1 Tax=Kribbella sp. CA-247076 TaxID=3239941 RepID=UPI003D92517E
MALEDIAGYSLRRKLGSGSAGTVWLVRDRASGRNAVLKRIPTTAIAHPEELREDLAVLQRITHPHLARLQEVRETGTEWLLFSQYVVAGSLSALLGRRGPLTDGELVTLLSPLTEALDHLHRSGLTHGRVTPANIMFDADGRPLLTDPALHPHLSTPRTPTNPSTPPAEPTTLPPPSAPTTPPSPSTSTAPPPRSAPTAQPPHPTPPDDWPTRAQRYTLADDFAALAAVAHHSGGDPTTFTPNLLTPAARQSLLSLATPVPINLAFTDDKEPTTPPRPRPTTKPPTPPDPPHRARTPLAPLPPVTPPPTTPQPVLHQPPPPKPLRPTVKPTRVQSRTKLGRARTPPPNPLSRLTPPPAAHADPTATTPSEVDRHDADHAELAEMTSGLSSSGNWSASVAHAPDAPTAVRSQRGVRRPSRRRTWRRRRITRIAPVAALSRVSFRHPAYGVLAAVGLGAAVVLILGLITVGVLDNPTHTAATTNQPTSPTNSSASSTTPSTNPSTSTSPAAAASPSSKQLPSTTTSPTQPPKASRADAAKWTQTLQALDTQRAQAFWTLDPRLLDRVYVPGSAPWSADRALLATYRKHELRIRDLQIRITSTTVESRTPTTVVLRTTDHLTAGQAVTRTGTATQLPPAPPTTRLITLTTHPTTTAPTRPPTGPSTPTTSRADAATTWRISAITAA